MNGRTSSLLPLRISPSVQWQAFCSVSHVLASGRNSLLSPLERLSAGLGCQLSWHSQTRLAARELSLLPPGVSLALESAASSAGGPGDESVIREYGDPRICDRGTPT